MADKQKRMIAEFDAAFKPFLNGVKNAKIVTKDFEASFNYTSSQVEKSSKKATKGLSQVKKAALALGGTATLYAFKALTDQAKQMDNQLRAIGAGSDDMKKRVFSLAIETRTPIQATVSLLRNMQKSLKDQSLDQTIRQVGTLNRLLTIGGLDRNARGSVALQFGQALQSGVLAGDELRSLREAAPIELLEAIAKAAGGSVEGLRKLGSQGKLTRKVMVQALENLESESKEKFAAFKMTISEATSAMQTSILAVAGSFDQGLGVTDQIASSLQKLSVFMLDNADAAETLGEAFQMVFQLALLLAGSRGLAMLGTAIGANVVKMIALQRTMGATAVAMRGMGSAMALMGGPIGVALFAAGAAVLAIRANVKSFKETLEDTDSALKELDKLPEKYDTITDAILKDMALLKKAQAELATAIEAGGDAAVLAAEREVQAIQTRIDKNRELARIQIALAADQLQKARDGVSTMREGLVPAFNGDLRNAPERQDSFNQTVEGREQMIADKLSAILEKSYKDRSDTEIKWLRNYQAFLKKKEALQKQEVLVAELTAEAIDKATGTNQTGGDGSAGEAVFEAEKKKAEQALEAAEALMKQLKQISTNKASFEELENKVKSVDDLLKGYTFDDDDEVRAGVNLVSKALAEAKDKVDELDEAGMKNLQEQVKGLLGLMDIFLSKIGATRDSLADGEIQYGPNRRPTSERVNRSKSARDAARKGIFDLIGYAEGTDKKRGYNETLAYGKFTGGEQNLTSMTLREILALQRQMLKHPDNSYNSSALGRYQIVGKTLGGKGQTGKGGLVKEMGLSLDDLFDEEMQDRMAAQLVRRRKGQGVEGMRNEWEGLRKIPGNLIQDALGEQSIPLNDVNVADRIRDETDAREDALDVRKQFAMSVEEEQARRQLEIDLIGKTVSEQAYMITKFELLNRAKADGIKLDEKIAGTTRTYKEEIEALSKAAQEDAAAQENRAKAIETAEEKTKFLEDVTGTLKDGLIDAIIEGDNFADVLGNVAKMLAKAALQAALFGEGPFAGSGGGGAGGAGGGLFGFIGDWIGGLFGGATASANGNVMTSSGPMALKKYAAGGIASSPQLSLFGEGDTPEAYVPLPDGRSIPVTLKTPDLGRLMQTPSISQGSDGMQQRLQVNIFENASETGEHQVDHKPAEGRVDIRLKKELVGMVGGGQLDGVFKQRFGIVPGPKGG